MMGKKWSSFKVQNLLRKERGENGPWLAGKSLFENNFAVHDAEDLIRESRAISSDVQLDCAPIG